MKIYNEDCLETMKNMEDGSVDLVVTSPPYNMNLRIRNGKYCSRQIVKEFSTKYRDFPDNLPIEEYYKKHSRILDEILRVSKLSFYVVQVVTGSKRALFKMIGDFSDSLKEIIVWDKGNGQPAMKEKVLNRETELILVFEKENAISRQFKNANFERGTLNDIWLLRREPKEHKSHGATFPEKLVRLILQSFSKEGQLIYDPFMGTGTTGVVAKMMKRKFIGSEIVKSYADFAEKRILETKVQAEMF